jgi:hypothetical protein
LIGRLEMVQLCRRLYDAGFNHEAQTLVAAWNRTNVGNFSDMDPTPWEELLEEAAVDDIHHVED